RAGECQFYRLADPPACQKTHARSADRVQAKYQGTPYGGARYGSQSQSRPDPANMKASKKPEEPYGQHEERQVPQWNSAERIFCRKQERARLNVKACEQPGVKE